MTRTTTPSKHASADHLACAMALLLAAAGCKSETLIPTSDKTVYLFGLNDAGKIWQVREFSAEETGSMTFFSVGDATPICASRYSLPWYGYAIGRKQPGTPQVFDHVDELGTIEQRYTIKAEAKPTSANLQATLAHPDRHRLRNLCAGDDLINGLLTFDLNLQLAPAVLQGLRAFAEVPHEHGIANDLPRLESWIENGLSTGLGADAQVVVSIVPLGGRQEMPAQPSQADAGAAPAALQP